MNMGIDMDAGPDRCEHSFVPAHVDHQHPIISSHSYSFGRSTAPRAWAHFARAPEIPQEYICLGGWQYRFAIVTLQGVTTRNVGRARTTPSCRCMVRVA